jgi:hypothetical protein
MVARELSRFAGVSLAPKLDAASCPERRPRCLVDAYRAAGAQVIILGELRDRSLAYQVYDSWTGTRAFEGSLTVAGVTTATLRRHVGDIVRPIVQRGGLLDERPQLSDAPPTAAAASTPTTPSLPSTATVPPRLLVGLLAALLLLTAAPLLLARLLLGGRELRKRERPRSWIWSTLLLALLTALLLASTVVDLRAALAALATPSGRALRLILPIAAGMLWGSFALSTVAWVFAPIDGLGQVRHDALFSLLRAWLMLALLRALTLVAYLPPLWLTLRAASALQLPERVTLALLLPAIGLLLHFWLLSLVDNLALYLDVQLVIGSAGARNPWHATIKRYFRGYVRRNAVPLDARLLDRTLFLPSLLPNIICYGGGFARPRLLVDEKSREAALGGLPEEEEFPERTVNPEELPLGLIAPASAAPADIEARLLRGEQRRRELTQAPARRRALQPRLVGESATLLGWVLPQPTAEGIPLISNSSEDFDVVKRLLTEHYAAFERNLDDDEVDDTDPTQKDFLYGALIRELGVLARGDALLSTLRYSLVLFTSKTWIYRLLIRPPIKLHERFLSGPAARVADGYAALHAGLHHLIQYLCFLRGADETLLTARANMPRLMQTSRDLLERVDRDRLSAEERDLLRATPRDRVVWLSHFFHETLAPRSSRALRLAVALLVTFTVGGVITVAVRQAIDYHPVYVERMRSTQGAAADERPPAR